MTTRRAFLRGLTGFVACAPAIVRASSLMAIKPLEEYRITEITVLPGAVYTPLSLSQIADFLCPGIRDIVQRYDLPPQWPELFAA